MPESQMIQLRGGKLYPIERIKIKTSDTNKKLSKDCVLSTLDVTAQESSDVRKPSNDYINQQSDQTIDVFRFPLGNQIEESYFLDADLDIDHNLQIPIN